MVLRRTRRNFELINQRGDQSIKKEFGKPHVFQRSYKEKIEEKDFSVVPVSFSDRLCLENNNENSIYSTVRSKLFGPD